MVNAAGLLRSGRPSPALPHFRRTAKMTSNEAISRYRTAVAISSDEDSCYSITPRLIRGDALSPAQTELVDALDEAFVGSAAVEDLLLYRGAHRSFIEVIQNSDDGRYQSFVSTSMALSEGMGFLAEHGDDAVLLQIQCAAGLPCINVSDAKIATLEQAEVLLPRNTRFNVEAWNPFEGMPIEQQLQFQLRPASGYFRLTVIPAEQAAS